MVAHNSREPSDRRHGIGGSDIAAILGLSPWRTPFQVWLEKTGRSHDQGAPSEAMLWGQRLEPLVLEAWAERAEGEIVSRGQEVALEEWPVARGTIDAIGRTKDGLVVVEAKTGRSWGWPGEGIPIHYQAQVHWYLGICSTQGIRAADVAVLLDGSTFRVYRVEYDADVFERLLDAARDWWARHVAADQPPPAETVLDAKILRSMSVGVGDVEADMLMAERIATLATLKSSLRSTERKIEELELAILRDWPSDARRIVSPHGTLTWVQPQERDVLDAQAIERHYPELAAKHRKVVRSSGYLRLSEGRKA